VHYKTMGDGHGAQVNGSLLHSDKPVARIEHKPEAADAPAATPVDAVKG